MRAARLDLSRRSDAAELMDEAGMDDAALRGCLGDLARVNALSMGYRPTLAFLDRLRREGRLPTGRALEVLDVGCGYGDGLRAVAAWGARRGVAVRLTGLDLAPAAIRAAEAATPPGLGIRWVAGDALSHEGGADLVVSALFAHHLGDGDLVRFIRWMEARARLGWFVNDLHRHPLPARAFGPLARALGLHPFVVHDGPVSFARAFVPSDWQRLLAAAGLPPGAADVRRAFPFRLCVARVRAA